MDFIKACGHTVLLAGTSMPVLQQLIEVCQSALFITKVVSVLCIVQYRRGYYRQQTESGRQLVKKQHKLCDLHSLSIFIHAQTIALQFPVVFYS